MTLNSQSRRKMREGARKGGRKRGRERRRKAVVKLLDEKATYGITPERIEQIDARIAELREKGT
jgi:hypothetical protein